MIGAGVVEKLLRVRSVASVMKLLRLPRLKAHASVRRVCAQSRARRRGIQPGNGSECARAWNL
eukprot:6202343-Pleurochrysis_carterae.AAC.1